MHYEKFQDGTVKCIEDEIPFEIPEGWAWARIFSITEDLPYGTAKKSMQTGLVAVLRMGNIQSGEIDYSDLVYSSDIDDIAKYTLIKNDLLFNRTNSAEWVGKTAIYRGNIPAMYAGYLIRMRAFIDSEYLNVVMNSGYAKAYCNSVKTDGVNQSNINAQKLGNFLVPIPSPTEQKRISTNIVDFIPRISMIQGEKEQMFLHACLNHHQHNISQNHQNVQVSGDSSFRKKAYHFSSHKSKLLLCYAYQFFHE